MQLTDTLQNNWHKIEKLEGPTEGCNRLLDIGLTPGEEISIVQVAPFGDPLIVLVRGTRLALRRQEAAWIWVQ